MCQLIVGKNPLFKKSSMFCGALPFQNGSLASASLPQAFYRGCLQHSDPFLLGYDSICLEMMVNPVAACGALCAGLTIISGQINCDQAEMDHYAPMAHSVQGNAVRRCFL